MKPIRIAFTGTLEELGETWIPPEPELTLPQDRPRWIPRRPSRADGGHGRVARIADLDQANRKVIVPNQDATFPNAILLAEGDKDIQLHPLQTGIVLPDPIRERHLLAIGKTGSGKTTKILLPMIAADLRNPQRSLIVADAKGDLTGPVLEMVRTIRGPKAKVVYLSFHEPERSVGWNPLAKPMTMECAKEIVACLARTHHMSKNETTFFRDAAMEVIADTLTAVAGSPGMSLGRLAGLFFLDLSSLQQELERLGLGHVEAVKHADSNNNALTVLMEVRNYLAPFRGREVSAVTAADEFDFDDLLAEPTVLIVTIPEGMRRLQGLNSLFVQELFRWVVERSLSEKGKRLERPVSCFLDEFASAIGELHEIERSLNTFRSRNFCFTAAVQSLAQLVDVYGSARARVILEGFGSIVCVPPFGFADAEEVAQRMPVFLTESYETNASGLILRQRPEPRPVLTPQEMAYPPRHPELGSLVTLLLSEVPPILAYLSPIWDQPEFASWKRSDGKFPPLKGPSRRKRPLSYSSVKVEASGQGLTNTRGWSDARIKERLKEVKKKLDWSNTTGSARKWWEAFEKDNSTRLGLVLRLAEELLQRKATITEFFLAYVYSNTDNIQANLHYLDYTRLKKAEEQKRRQAAMEARKASEPDPPEEVDPDEDDEDDEDDLESDQPSFEGLDEYDPFA